MTFVQKEMRPAGLARINGRPYKCYHVDRAGHELEPEVVKAAEEFIPELVPPLADDSPAGWIVIHRGDDSGAYLLVYTWAWDNVVDTHTASAGQPALGCPDSDPTHFVRNEQRYMGCVWELAVLEHERTSFVRHMLAPDEPDLDAYLADLRPAGEVGR